MSWKTPPTSWPHIWLSSGVEGIKTSNLLKVKRQPNQMKKQKNNSVKSINIIRRSIQEQSWYYGLLTDGTCKYMIQDAVLEVFVICPQRERNFSFFLAKCTKCNTCQGHFKIRILLKLILNI